MIRITIDREALVDREALIRRVRKLLAKAESTANPNEAEAFSAKAAELIAAHRLDPDHVRDSLDRGTVGLRRIPLGRGAYVRARLALLMAVARSHDCEVVFETGPDGTVAVVAGFDTDLVVTALLYESLHVQAAGQMATTKLATPAATQRWRRSFLFGYARRIGEMLDLSRSQVATPRSTSAAPTLFDDSGSASVPDLLARASRVKAFAKEAFGPVRTARAVRPATAKGWNDGQRAAGSADIGRSRLGNRRALGRGSNG
jgi:hypothetical protein